jgi:soluble cytochrome b562
LRLIFNETQKKLICSTATKDNVSLAQGEGGTLVEVPTSVCSLKSTDLLTIKCDYGDNLEEVKEAVENIDLSSVESKVETESQAIQSAIQNIDLSSVESKVDEVKQAVENIDLTPIENKVQEGVNILSSKIDNIDLSAVENKVQEESAAIQNKLDNLNVEVDLTQVARQGNNQEATMSVLYEELMKLNGSYADQIKDIVGE